MQPSMGARVAGFAVKLAVSFVAWHFMVHPWLALQLNRLAAQMPAVAGTIPNPVAGVQHFLSTLP